MEPPRSKIEQLNVSRLIRDRIVNLHAMIQQMIGWREEKRDLPPIMLQTKQKFCMFSQLTPG